jgi:O-antigen/teichoic acid export membrane protein
MNIAAQSPKRSAVPFVPQAVRAVACEALVVAVGNVAAGVGGLMAVRILTTRLEPRVYGELALAMTVTILGQQVVFGPLAGAIVRFYAPAKEAHSLAAFAAASKRVLFVASAAVAIVAAVCIPFIGNFAALPFAACILSVVLAIVNAYNSAVDGIQNAARQRIIVACNQGLGQWVRVGAVLLTTALFGATASAALLGYIASASIILCSQLFFLSAAIPPSGRLLAVSRIQRNNIEGRIIKYAWPFAVWAPFTWIQLSADRWALRAYTDTAHVGIYQALFQLGYYPITLACGSLMQLAMPILFERAGGAGSSSRTRSAYSITAFVTALTSAGTIIFGAATAIFHKPLCRLLLAPKYWDYSYLLPFIVLAGGLFACGQAISLNLLTGLSTAQLIGPKIGSAVLGLLCTVLFTAIWGIDGTVAASIVFSVSYLVWVLVVARSTLVAGMRTNELVSLWQEP